MLSAITTTVYDPTNPVVSPQIKAYSISTVFEPKPLPRSEAKWTPNEYLTQLFGEKLLDEIPTIEITSGQTDYLDLVKPTDFNEVHSHNLPLTGKENTCMAKGMDVYGRHFVAFGFELFSEATNKTYHYIYTLFRRYSNLNSHYVICRSHYSEAENTFMDDIFDNSIGVNNKVYATLQKLIDNYRNGNSGLMIEHDYPDYNTNSVITQKYRVKMYNPNKME